jgi:hypothetical protein
VHRVASLFKRSLLNAYQHYPKLHLQDTIHDLAGDDDRWRPAIRQDGSLRPKAAVAD